MSWTRASRARTGGLRRVAAVALCVGCVGATGSALAQAPARAGDAAMAETLFNEGKRLMAAGDFAAACPKLAESNRLDPGGGTLTALAVCHEGLGKTASAWTEFIQVVSDARQAGRTDREKFAQQHVDALEPKLSKLTVVVDPALAALPGLEVLRDGTAIGAAGWGTAAPVDPGEHSVEVRATGKKTWSTKATVGDSGDLQTVTVPVLEDQPAGLGAAVPSNESGSAAPHEGDAEPASPDEARSASAGGTQRVVGLVVGGAGVVAAGIGTYFGLQAISKSNDANGKCPDPTQCRDASAVSSNSDAKSAAQSADIVLGGAAVAVVAGVVIYLLAPSSSPAATKPSQASVPHVPANTPQRASLALRASW